jgi:type I restriction enzyme R subunit
MITEADTCRKYILPKPKLIQAGWDNDPHSFTEQKSFTDGRIVLVGNQPRRRPQKRANYLLRYTRDVLIGVVEAKAAYMKPGDGLQQAKDYAGVLGPKFAYSTNGHGIVEFDFLTGKEREIDTFPAPDELWQRFRMGQGLHDDKAATRYLTPSYHLSRKSPRYYQEIAINRTVQSILQGKRRILLTMATGTGKTVVAFQICWKLWNRTGDHRRPKILYLADRNILIDDPKDKMRQGIEDGFLAPYRVHRVVTTWDATGWRRSQQDIDRYGRQIPDDEYQTKTSSESWHSARGLTRSLDT